MGTLRDPEGRTRGEIHTVGDLGFSGKMENIRGKVLVKTLYLWLWSIGHMPKHRGPMNLEMQLSHIKGILDRYNPLWKDHGYPPDGWQDEVDPALSLPENIDDLEKRYPNVHWRAPKKPPRSDKPIQWKDEDFQAGQYGNYYEMHAGVTVKPHPTRAKGKLYTCGRIQLTVDKRYIGRTAEVHIIIRH